MCHGCVYTWRVYTQHTYMKHKSITENNNNNNKKKKHRTEVEMQNEKKLIVMNMYMRRPPNGNGAISGMSDRCRIIGRTRGGGGEGWRTIENRKWLSEVSFVQFFHYMITIFNEINLTEQLDIQRKENISDCCGRQCCAVSNRGLKLQHTHYSMQHMFYTLYIE